MLRRFGAALAIDLAIDLAIVSVACFLGLGFVLLPAVAFADVAGPALAIPPDLIGTLIAGYGMPAIVIWAIACLVCSILCAVTPTPAPGSRWSALYELIELVAVNTRTAKMTGIPIVDAMHAAQLEVLGSVHTATVVGDPIKPPPAPGSTAAVLLVFAFGTVLLCAACASGNAPLPVTPSAAAAALQTPQAQSLINGVGNFTPGVAQVVAKVNQGLAVAQSDKQLVCGGMSYANAAYRLLAPALGASSADAQNEAASMTTVEDLCDNDTGNLGAAVATVAKAYADTTAQLQAVGAPVPAAPPVATAPSPAASS
jgi:hypothetical protein